MPRTLPEFVPIPGYEKPVRFPLSMSDEEVHAGAKAAYEQRQAEMHAQQGQPAPGLSAHPAPPAAAMLTPEEKAAPTMTAGGDQPIGAGEEEPRGFLDNLRDAGRVTANGMSLGLLPTLSAAVDATIPVDEKVVGKTQLGLSDLIKGNEKPPSWMDRYRHAKSYYEQAEEDSEKHLAHPTLLKLAGAMATNGALPWALTDPLATGAKALIPALKGTGLLKMAAKAALGVGDASVMGGAIEAGKHWDEGKEKVLEESKKAITSPWNLLGATTPLLEEAPEIFESMADKRALRTTKASPKDVNSIRDEFGGVERSGPGSAGRWLQTAKTPSGEHLIAPGDTGEDMLRKISEIKDATGEQKRALALAAKKAGAYVDLADMSKQVYDSLQKHVTPELRTADPVSAKRIEALGGRIAKTLQDQGGRGGKGDVESWEATKSALQSAAQDAYESGKVSTPYKNFTKDIARIIRQADEGAVLRAQGPDAAKSFIHAKDEYGRASTFSPIYRKLANADSAKAAGASSNVTSFLRNHAVPAAAGTVAGVVSHNPELAIAAGAAGLGLDAFRAANPTMTRAYAGAAKALPAVTPRSTTLLPTALRQSTIDPKERAKYLQTLSEAAK